MLRNTTPKRVCVSEFNIGFISFWLSFSQFAIFFFSSPICIFSVVLPPSIHSIHLLTDCCGMSTILMMMHSLRVQLLMLCLAKANLLFRDFHWQFFMDLVVLWYRWNVRKKWIYSWFCILYAIKSNTQWNVCFNYFDVRLKRKMILKKKNHR